MRFQNVLLGKIVRNNMVEGTGFFLDAKTILTALHVVTPEIEDLNLKEEKAVELDIDEYENIQATSLNLVDAIDNRVDCVLLGTEEVFEEAEKIRLIVPENNIQGYECEVVGYPKELGTLIELTGQISVWEKTEDSSYDIVVNIKKQDKLQNYEGISGGPIMICNNVIGFAVRQLSESRIVGISLKKVMKYFPKVFTDRIVISKLKKSTTAHWTSIEEKCDYDYFEKHLKQALCIAGPRYIPELNVENETFALVNKILDKKSIEKEVLEAEREWRTLYQSLCNSIGDTRDVNWTFLEKNIKNIRDIMKALQISWDGFKGQKLDKNGRDLQTQLSIAETQLKGIFEEEKERFEEKNGKGTYNNRSWKGFMASYMGTFPTYHLEELERAVGGCRGLVAKADVEELYLYKEKTVLLIGRGGMGKTHLLCDIVNQRITKHMPALIFFGEQFGMNNAVSDIMLKRLGLEQISFDEFLAWLDEKAEREQCYIPLCIDALNETTQDDYWNTQLLSLIAAIENFNNIKLIVSCRSIYLKEVLDEDKISRMAIVEQKGFEQVEIKAIRQFGEYYGVQLNFDYLLHQEYRNPLYLKMLCEVVKEQGNLYAEIGDLMKLMKDFFDMKDKKISKELSISVREHIVNEILRMIIKQMVGQGTNYIQWKELRELVKNVLMEHDIVGKTQLMLKKLLSENLLKESDLDDERIVFGYERFYEIVMAQSIVADTAEETIQRICQIQGKQQLSIGTLEMLQILFVRKFQQEVLEYFAPEEWDDKWVTSFGQSLYWRNNEDVIYITKSLVELFLKDEDEEKVRSTLLAVLGVSTKLEFALNAEYLHVFLSQKTPMWRDYYLSYFLLGSFNNEKTIHDICVRSQKVSAHEISEQGAVLWGMTLAWLCSLNDIRIRDNASKGLANLFCQNPHIILMVIKQFEGLEEDYIQERLWQAAYSVLLLIENEGILKSVVSYIETWFVKKELWPENVLIRDYLFKIIEYAVKRNIVTEDTLEKYLPPYKSEKLKPVSKKTLEKWEKENRRLYFNCMDSDFAIYTIPSKVNDYGVSKQEVGGIIMKCILDSGYNETIEKYDQMIDYKYGSLRSRDPSVERIGKKYQKIFLYRCMGRIYDNYKRKPRYSYDEDVELIPGEQGTSFRTIDLTALPYEVEQGAFNVEQIQYPFSRYRDFTDENWFQKNDVWRYFAPVFSKMHEKEEYLILQGYFRDKEAKESDYREMWVQIRSYLFEKKYKQKLLDWMKEKDFEGRWMPEGTNSLYEISVGEYPWSSYLEYYLGDTEEEQDFRNIPPAPCYIDPTANDYNNEKDSEFCPSDIAGKFIFPCKRLFDSLDLKWDGKNGFWSNGKPIIYLSEGKDSAIYINKKRLSEYLEQTEQEVVWTVLGEKQKIVGMGFDNFPGRSEFSYSYYLDNDELKMNHEVFHVLEARKFR